MSLLAPEMLAVPDDKDDDLIIQPGADPPFVIPWCASCKQTVDTFTIDPVSNPFRMGVQATCHGATEGTWVLVSDLFKRKRLGQPIVMFKRVAFNQVR